MKLLKDLTATIAIATMAIFSVVSAYRDTFDPRVRYGLDPRDIIEQVRREGFADWPVVVHCTDGSIAGVEFGESVAYIFPGFSKRECRVKWCHPKRGSCMFRLHGDGGSQNWWQINWSRNDKVLCHAVRPNDANWREVLNGSPSPCAA
ncbi:hypothetical protein TWF481_008740 [Arthrobotrys musiformis]|uniref:Uncharacterized protein n=1 Tax=Arthrobotrys musiformis TaxID=47236 RepID=A0AAV9W9K8_9PEZI